VFSLIREWRRLRRSFALPEARFVPKFRKSSARRRRREDNKKAPVAKPGPDVVRDEAA
jgi:hypothetical protein